MPGPRRLDSIDESRAAELPDGEAISSSEPQPNAAAKAAGGEVAAAALGDVDREREWYKDPVVRIQNQCKFHAFLRSSAEAVLDVMRQRVGPN